MQQSSLPILCGLVENRYPALTAGTSPVGPAIQQGEDMLFVLLGGQVDSTTPSIPESTSAQPLPIPQPTYPYQSTASNTQQTLMDPALIAWNDQISFGPSDTFPANWLQMPSHLTNTFNLSAPQSGALQPGYPMEGDGQEWLHGADPGEVWARLQTFYEPAIPVPFWMGGMGAGSGGFENGGGVGAWAGENREFGL